MAYLGLMMSGCSGGDASRATEGDPTGSTTKETGATVDATTTTTGASTTTGAPTTTGGESSTTGGTDGTDTSTMTGPPVSSWPDDPYETNGGPAPEVTCGELPPGVVGEPYSTFVSASGGAGQNYSWEFMGKHPNWLSLISDSSDTAELAGVPEEPGVEA